MYLIFTRSKYSDFSLILLLVLLVQRSFAADCVAIFPDGVQNSGASGSITFDGQARITASPDNLIDTTNLIDNAGANVSCDGISCTSSGSVVSDTSITAYPSGQPNISLGFFGSATVSPGNYNSMTLDAFSTLNMQPGVYRFRQSIDIGFLSQIVVTAPGSVVIYVRRDINLNTLATINSAGGDRYVFLYSRRDVDLGFASAVTATIYSRRDVTLSSNAVINGSLTARRHISLGFASRINFSSTAVQNTDYDTFCTPASVATLDHFAIDVGAGTASTCLPQAISIRAEDALNNTLNDYAGNISIRVSSGNGDWSKTSTPSDAQGALSPGVSDSGLASYAFEAIGLDQGAIMLELDNTHAETITIDVSDVSAGVTSTSTNLTFSENAFVVSATDSLGNDVIAGRTHNFQIQMIRDDPATGNCGAAPNYNVGDVKAWISRDAADPGGGGPQLTNSGASDTEVLANNAPLSANLTLSFVSGTAAFTLLSSDVGRYSLQFRDDSFSFSDQPIIGGSHTFTSRPFGVYVTVNANPGATTASGDTFISASSDFTVSATAVAWSASDDTNDDGIPDNHNDIDPSNNAVLSDNTVLISFGGETPAEAIQLSSQLFLPSGGTDPGLSSSAMSPGDGRQMTSFTHGASTTNDVYFSEVGIIEIGAMVLDGDYLSAGALSTSKIIGKTGHVGRFYPSSFIVTPVSTTAACTTGLDYSYMGENFSSHFSVSALSALGTVTANYVSDFIKLSELTGISFGAIDSAAPTLLSNRLSSTFGSVSWNNGIGSLRYLLAIGRDASIDGPYSQVNIGVTATDSDGVTVSGFNLDVDNNMINDHIQLDQTELRFGRLRLMDAFGPETAALPVNFHTEYWTGLIWQLNLDDSCTSIAQTAITYPGGSIDVLANRTVTVGGGLSVGQYDNDSGGRIHFSGGGAGHNFTPPGTGNTGAFDVNVNLSAHPWLRYDWDKDGDHTDSALPSARYTFGSYRGHDRVIYWNEVLQ